MRRVLVLAIAVPTLSGCVARAAYDVVTLPVRAGSQVVDWSTTSQSEADRNRGRKMRKDEERQRKEAAKEDKRQRKLAREQGNDGRD